MKHSSVFHFYPEEDVKSPCGADCLSEHFFLSKRLSDDTNLSVNHRETPGVRNNVITCVFEVVHDYIK